MDEQKHYSGIPGQFDGNGMPDTMMRKQLRLSDILYAVRKRMAVIIVCAVVGLIVGIGMSVVSYMRGEMSKEYAITSAIAVTSQDKNGLFTAQSSNPNSNDIYLAENMVDSVIYVMKSDQTLNAAIEKLQLLGVSNKDIYRNLTLTQYKETQIIESTLYWRSAQEGVQILTAINDVAQDILVETLKIGNVSVINPPTSRYLIGGSLNAMLWIYMVVLGAMLGVGYAVLELLLRPTLLKTEDMERYYGLEVLGEIPDRSKYFQKKRNLLLFSEDDGRAPEILDNYISLAHIVKARLSKMEHPCVYITSANQHEGKTTVSAYLAVQLAEIGVKVLVVDFDTRNPRLGGLFLNKVEYINSINALYRGDTVLEDAITQLTANLDILPAVLERIPLPFDDALLNIVSDLKKHYDVILMDTAPVGLVADTMSLNQLADVAMLVVRFDGSSLDTIRDAMGRLGKSGMSIMGCVINGVKNLSKNGSGGGYGKYGYGYGYGYHSSYAPYRSVRAKTEREMEWERWESNQAELALQEQERARMAEQESQQKGDLFHSNAETKEDDGGAI